ncbi:hypothetical protein D3C79_994360 [compost metagenome]
MLRLVRVNYDEAGALVDCDIEHWRPDAIRICLDTRALLPPLGTRAGTPAESQGKIRA